MDSGRQKKLGPHDGRANVCRTRKGKEGGTPTLAHATCLDVNEDPRCFLNQAKTRACKHDDAGETSLTTTTTTKLPWQRARTRWKG